MSETAGASVPKRLKDRFLEWSGGWPPESDWQVLEYVEAAADPADGDDDDQQRLLLDWMYETWTAAGR